MPGAKYHSGCDRLARHLSSDIIPIWMFIAVWIAGLIGIFESESQNYKGPSGITIAFTVIILHALGRFLNQRAEQSATAEAGQESTKVLADSNLTPIIGLATLHPERILDISDGLSVTNMELLWKVLESEKRETLKRMATEQLLLFQGKTDQAPRNLVWILGRP